MLYNYIFKQISWNESVNVPFRTAHRYRLPFRTVFILNFVRSILVAFDTV